MGVAVQDVEPGRRAVYQDTDREVEIEVPEAVPWATGWLTDLPEGALLREYREPIGLTRRAVASGGLVHVHNLTSARWRTSE